MVDLLDRTPECREYPDELQRVDCEYFGVSDARELATPDWLVFETGEEGDLWLSNYARTLGDLDNAVICKQRRGLPAMLYKRRYIVQALMGTKTFTTRHYDKATITPGQLFNLHDQTFFLTVRCTKKTGVAGGWRYDYELP